MSKFGEGGINDQLQRIGETLFDGAPPAIDDVDDQLQLVKEVSVARFFPLYYKSAAGDEYLYCTPPKGKVWIIHDARLRLVTDENVADRTFTIFKMYRPEEAWLSLQSLIEATVAASTSYDLQLHQACSADPHPAIDSYLPQDTIILSGGDLKGRFGERIQLRAVNKEAGDLLHANLSIEERTNYML